MSLLKKEKEFNSLEVFKKAQAGSEKDLLYLIDLHKPLLISIVKKYQVISSEKEDIYQCGLYGLIKAIKNFDTSYGTVFSTYAVPLILGEIKKHFRDNNLIHISRTTKENYKKIIELEMNYEDKSLTIEQISSLLNLSKEDIIEALESNVKCYSLDTPITDDGDLTLLDTLSSNEENSIKFYDLKEEIDKLDKKEKLIIELRYFKGLTQNEVSKRLFMSQVQISRIEKKILNKLKMNILKKSLHTNVEDEIYE